MHQTEAIVVNGQNVEIDCLMVPFIKWLNNLSSIRTNFCCEGDEQQQPYVSFKCDSDDDLRIILRNIQPEAIGAVTEQLQQLLPDMTIQTLDQYVFATCEVHMDTVSKWYIVRFLSQSNLILFNQFMEFN